jgi:hypothetical protein
MVFMAAGFWTLRSGNVGFVFALSGSGLRLALRQEFMRAPDVFIRSEQARQRMLDRFRCVRAPGMRAVHDRCSGAARRQRESGDRQKKGSHVSHDVSDVPQRPGVMTGLRGRLMGLLFGLRVLTILAYSAGSFLKSLTQSLQHR